MTQRIAADYRDIDGELIAILPMAESQTVTVCHHMTREVAVHTCRADAVLVVVGKPGLLRTDMLKPGSVVIDIGINQMGIGEAVVEAVSLCEENSQAWLYR